MSYYVLGVWFKKLKLTERKKYVPFIVHFLQNAKKSPSTDESSPLEDKISSSEDVEMVLDILAQNCFADCMPEPIPNNTGTLQQTDEEYSLCTKSWLYGNSIITVQISPFVSQIEKHGWMDITIRRPSGFIHLRSRLENPLRDPLRDFDLLLGNTSLDPAISLDLMNDEKKEQDLGLSQELKMLSLTDLNVTASPNRSRSSSLAVAASDESLKGELHKYSTLPRRNRSSTNNIHSDEAISSLIDLPKQPTLAITSTSLQQQSTATTATSFIDPSFPFLQLLPYPDWTAKQSKPIILPTDDSTKRALRVLDRIPIVDLHKIGVVYVGPGQTAENEILSNASGSRSYHEFLQSLGDLVRLKGCKNVYTGGLDTSEELDGPVAFWFGDRDTFQMIFHITTMMPNMNVAGDGGIINESYNNKKRHIGNNFVLVVWNESGIDVDAANGGWKFDTIAAQVFLFLYTFLYNLLLLIQ